MDTDTPTIPAARPSEEIISLVSQTENLYYPVVDERVRIIGAITLHGIRNTFATEGLNSWLVALDIMEPVAAKVVPEMPLSDAIAKARRYGLDYLPVVHTPQDERLQGLLDCPAVRRALSAEVLSRQEKADSVHPI